MACDINTLLASACSNGFSCLDDRSLKIAVLQLLCNQSTSTACCGLIDSGSPEGVKTANPGVTYFDTSINSFWIKKTGTGNTGWLQLIA